MKTLSFYLCTLLLLAQLDFAIRSAYAVNPRLLQSSGVSSIGRGIPIAPRNHLAMATARRLVKHDGILSIGPDLNLTISPVSDILGTPNVDDIVPGLDNSKYVVAQYVTTISKWTARLTLYVSFMVGNTYVGIGWLNDCKPT